MKPDIETARSEMIEASKNGAKIFMRLCDEEERVGIVIMSLAFSYAIAARMCEDPIPLAVLHEMIDLAYDVVHSADDQTFKGAEKYGIQ